MARIGLLTMQLTPRDAVTHDMVGMCQALRARGHEVRLFAREADAGLAEPAAPAAEATAFLRSPKDLLIYHFSIGWPEGLDVYRRASCRRAVKYHNITPADFYRRVNDEYAARCEAGRRELADLTRAGADLYLSDSSFNMHDLIAAGADPARSRAVPPFHQVDQLYAEGVHLGLLEACRDGRTNVLTVGRVAPNKGHLLLLDSFARYHHDYNPHSRLLIVGKQDVRLVAYLSRLYERAAELGIDKAVVFLGEVSAAELKALYLAADVFLMTSEHEGFCVPLVEAMALKVPVVAYATTAVPETVGGAGLVWDEPDLGLFAESVHTLAGDGAVSVSLAELGWQRYRRHYANHRIAAALTEALGGLL